MAFLAEALPALASLGASGETALAGTSLGSLAQGPGAGAISSLLNTLPSADTLKTFASGSGTDISDIAKAILGQQAANKPTEAPMPIGAKRGGPISLGVPPLISAQTPNPQSIMAKLGAPGTNPQLIQLLKALLSGQQPTA